MRKKLMKRVTAFAGAAILAMGVLTGCGGENISTSTSASGGTQLEFKGFLFDIPNGLAEYAPAMSDTIAFTQKATANIAEYTIMFAYKEDESEGIVSDTGMGYIEVSELEETEINGYSAVKQSLTYDANQSSRRSGDSQNVEENEDSELRYMIGYVIDGTVMCVVDSTDEELAATMLDIVVESMEEAPEEVE